MILIDIFSSIKLISELRCGARTEVMGHQVRNKLNKNGKSI